MARKISFGKSVKVTAAAALTKDTFAEVDGFFGLVLNSAAAGEEAVLDIEQAEYETNQVGTGTAFAVGDKVYFNVASGLFTTTNTDRMVGIATQASDANGVFSFILAPQV
jgi:predicted RecA/RadA family phage recombinase